MMAKVLVFKGSKTSCDVIIWTRAKGGRGKTYRKGEPRDDGPLKTMLRDFKGIAKRLLASRILYALLMGEKQYEIAQARFCTQSCSKLGHLLVNSSPTPHPMGSCRGLLAVVLWQHPSFGAHFFGRKTLHRVMDASC